jgi:urea ABC transporter ATP-binding protein UrtE
VLRVDDVWAGYGRGAPVLQGCSLHVQPGEIVAILGRNGAGKSTLLRAIVGVVPVARGRIQFQDHDITSMLTHRRVRSGLGYAPQGREIFPALSVLENLQVVGGRPSREVDARIAEVLDEFPMLRARLAARASGLSGGQQQALVLARALVARPTLLLLDEPTEGIQPSIVQEMEGHVRIVNRRRGVATLLVEQNLDFAARLAQRVYILSKGQVVREVAPAEILSDEELQREFIGV